MMSPTDIVPQPHDLCLVSVPRRTVATPRFLSNIFIGGCLLILVLNLFFSEDSWSGLLSFLLFAQSMFAISPIRKIERGTRLGLADVAVLGGALFAGVGASISAIGYNISNAWPGEFEKGDAVAALLLTMLGFATLWYVSRITSPVPISPLHVEPKHVVRLLIMALPLVWWGRIYQAYLGMTVGSVSLIAPMSLSPVDSIIVSINRYAGYGVVGLMSARFSIGAILRERIPLWLWLVAIPELGYQALQGRRLFLGVLVLVGFIVIACGVQVRIKHYAISVAVIVFALLLVWPFFFHARLAWSNISGSLQRTPDDYVKILRTAAGSYIDEFGRVEQEHIENVQQRAFNPSFLAELWRAKERRDVEYMHGSLLIAELLALIPRVFWERKFETLGSLLATEDLVLMHYGLPFFDRATTWLTDAFADWGPAGIAIYAALLALMCVKLDKYAVLMRGFWGSAFIFFGYCPMIVTVFQQEEHVMAILASIRASIILVPLAAAALFFLSPQPRERS